jgi:hypothetical protein
MYILTSVILQASEITIDFRWRFPRAREFGSALCCSLTKGLEGGAQLGWSDMQGR